MRYAFFSVIVVAALSATTAQAQRSDPDRHPSRLWNGLYAGAHAGIGLAGFDGVFDSSEVTGPGVTHNSVIGEHFELDGGLAGLQIGYSRQVGRMVYGLEADWTNFDASDRQFDPEDEGPRYRWGIAPSSRQEKPEPDDRRHSRGTMEKATNRVLHLAECEAFHRMSRY